MSPISRWRLRRCPHVNIRGIYGDEIIACGWWRLQCMDCQRYLEGPVKLAKSHLEGK